LTVISDSQLAINQLNGIWRVRKLHLKELFESVKILSKGFKTINFLHMGRETPFIRRADMLANLALDESI
jgi:ribonuclease HI